MNTRHSSPRLSRPHPPVVAGSSRVQPLLPRLLLAGLCLAGAGAASGADSSAAHWPQWRGPLANGVAPQGNPPVTWSETENVKWKVKIPGRGTGTPILWGNQVFIQTAIPTGKKVEAAAAVAAPSVFALLQAPADPPPQDGQRRRRPGGPGGGGGGGFGRGEKPTEVHQFALLSIDRATGKVQWQKTVREEVPHEGHHRDHSYASHSPVTDGQHVYSQCL